MQLTFWGARGSTPQSGPEYQYYGGHTSCTSLRVGKDLLVFDAGSGLVNLSQYLEQQTVLPRAIYFFISHPHLDHIMGLMGFAWLWKAKCPFEIYFISVYQSDSDGIEQVLHTLIHPPYFPLALKDSKARPFYHDMKETWQGEGWAITAFPLNHPGGSAGYRFDAHNYSLAFVTDTAAIESQPFYDWLKGVDLLIHDAMFTDQESELYPDWGHSSAKQAAELAVKVDAKNLILYHHHPYHTDDDLRHLERQAQSIFPNAAMARQGDVLDIIADS